MKNLYYSIRIYIEEYPSKIDCCKILDIANKICLLLGCEYEKMGYILLHPDYDYKDLGVMFCNSNEEKEYFRKLEIPLRYYGKGDEEPSAPSIIFEIPALNESSLPYFSIIFEYPVSDVHYLCIEIDVKADLMENKISLNIFKCVQDVFWSFGYKINTAFLHYYSGNMKRIMLEGGICGVTTVNDWRIIDHSIAYMANWKNKIMDVFYMNSIKKQAITNSSIEKLRSIVEIENLIEEDYMIMFKLSQSLSTYLMNRYISTGERKKIKKLLQKENLCNQDLSIISSILKL